MTMAPEDSARRLAAEHGLRFVDLSQAALAPGVATLVPEDVARQLHAVPIGRRLGTPVVAVSDPGNPTAWRPSGKAWAGSSWRWWPVPNRSNGPSHSSTRVAPPADGGTGISVGPRCMARFGRADRPRATPRPTGRTMVRLAYWTARPMSPRRPAHRWRSTRWSWGARPLKQPPNPATAPPAPDGYGLLVVPPDVDLSGLPPDAPALARVLVESHRVTVEDMTEALGAYQQSGESLARYLFNRGLATEDDLVRGMASEVGLDFVDLSTFPLDPRRLDAARVGGPPPHGAAGADRRRGAARRNGEPLGRLRHGRLAHDHGSQFHAGSGHPIADRHPDPLAYEGDVDMSGLAEDAADDMAPAGAGFELESLQSVVEDAPIVRYVNLLILQALNERASDIHIEPTPRRLRIRFRIDGVMQDATSASASIHPAVVSRLKVLGEMDIAEHRIPQEGRVSLSVGDRQIDLRLATLPSMFGETCVMRLLDSLPNCFKSIR